VRLSAGDTAVPDVDLLGRLVATGHLGELAHVAYFTPPGLLAVDPVEAGGLAFLYLFNLVHLMVPAKGAVSCEFRWHLHENFTDNPD
jgi:hypothetical protein